MLRHICNGKVSKNIETGKFNIKQFLNDKDYSNYRITLDRKEDLLLIKKIYSQLDDFCSWREVIKLIEKKPYLKKINNHIKLNEGSEIDMRSTKK